MAEVDMLTINTQIDDTGFKTLESTANKTFTQIAKQVNALNAEMDTLSKQREVLISAPKTDETKKKIAELDEHLSKLSAEREIKLSINKANFDNAKKDLKAIAEGFVKVTAVATAATAAFALFSVKMAGQLGAIEDYSKRLGLTTEAFQELSYIAKQTGTDIGSFSFVMRTLVQSAAAGDESFKKIGVSVKDANGKLKDQQTLFYETITALQNMEAGTARSKIAFDLLGRGALELAPLISAGAGSLQSMSLRAKELGAVIDGETIAAGDRLDDTFSDVKAVMMGLLYEVFIPMIPTIQELANYLIEVGKEARALAKEYMPGVIAAFKALADTLPYLIGFLGTYITVIVGAKVATMAWAAANALMITGIKGLTAALMANPIGLIAVGLATLVTLTIAAYKNWDKLTIIITTATQQILIALGILVSYIKTGFFATVGKIGELFLEQFEPILILLEMLPGKFGKAFGLIKSELDGYKKTITDWSKVNRDKEAEERKLALEEIGRLALLREKRLDALKASEELNDKTADVVKEQAATGSLSTEVAKNELADLERLYAAKKEIANETISDEEEKQAILLEIEREYLNKRLDLLKAAGEKQYAETGSINANILEDIRQTNDAIAALPSADTRDYPKELQNLQEVYDRKKEIAAQTITDEEDKNAQLVEIDRQYLEARLSLLREAADEQLKTLGAISDATKNNITQTMTEIEKMPQKTSGNMGQFAMQFVGQMQELFNGVMDYFNEGYSRQIDALQRNLESQRALIEAAEEQNLALREKYSEELTKLDEERSETMTQAEYEAYEQQRDALQEKYDNTLTTEEELAAQKVEIEHKNAIEKAKLERKIAENKKKQSIVNVLVSTAEAIMMAYAQLGPIAASVFAGIIAATSALQIATIMKQPLPEIPSFWEGGTVGAGNSSKVKGIKPSPNAQDRTLIWAAQGEEVLPVHEAEAYRNLFKQRGLSLSELFADRVRGTGGNVDNSNRIITQSVNIETKEGLSYAQSKRISEKFAKDFARAVA